MYGMEMTDDYLLQEFHEAGIWLPGEKDEMALLGMRYSGMEAALQQQQSAIRAWAQGSEQQTGLLGGGFLGAPGRGLR